MAQAGVQSQLSVRSSICRAQQISQRLQDFQADGTLSSPARGSALNSSFWFFNKKGSYHLFVTHHPVFTLLEKLFQSIKLISFPCFPLILGLCAS